MQLAQIFKLAVHSARSQSQRRYKQRYGSMRFCIATSLLAAGLVACPLEMGTQPDHADEATFLATATAKPKGNNGNGGGNGRGVGNGNGNGNNGNGNGTGNGNGGGDDGEPLGLSSPVGDMPGYAPRAERESPAARLESLIPAEDNFGRGKDKWDNHLKIEKEYRFDLPKQDWGAYLNSGHSNGLHSDDAMGGSAIGKTIPGDAGATRPGDNGPAARSQDGFALERGGAEGGQARGNSAANNAANGNNGLALGKTKEPGQGLALGKTKNGNNGLALGKTKQKDETDAPLAAAAAEPRGSRGSETSTGLIRPDSYFRHEVLALNLTPAGQARVAALGFSIVETSLPEAGGAAISRLATPRRLDAIAALRLLRGELPGERFHLNRLYHLYRPAKDEKDEDGNRTEHGGRGHPTRCLGDRCYPRHAIQWKDDLARCSRTLRVGVIDTGADLGHPTFAGQKIVQKSFVPNGDEASENWHGTGILALLAGRPDSGTPGLIPGATIFAAGIFFRNEHGEAITSTASLMRALDWMRASKVTLVNMSFSGPQDDLIRTHIADLGKEGFVFTAAAGNDGPAGEPSYPAAYPQVIGVTAVMSNLKVYPSANRGSYIDLAAPGVRIWTATPGGREGYRSGTSFAAPFVTAVLALQPQDSLLEPKDRLLDQLPTVALGGPGRNDIYGRGLLKAPQECPATPDAITSAVSSPVLRQP
jgi:hypothetical protein